MVSRTAALCLAVAAIIGCGWGAEVRELGDSVVLGASQSEAQPLKAALEAAKESVTLLKKQPAIKAALKEVTKLKKSYKDTVAKEKEKAEKAQTDYKAGLKKASKPLKVLDMQEKIIKHLKAAKKNESVAITPSGELTNSTDGTASAEFVGFTPPYFTKALKDDRERFVSDTQAQFFNRQSNSFTMRSFNAEVTSAKDLGKQGIAVTVACPQSGCASVSRDKLSDGGPTSSKKDLKWGCQSEATVYTEACQGCACKDGSGFKTFAKVSLQHKLVKGAKKKSCAIWFSRVDAAVKQLAEAVKAQARSIKAKQCLSSGTEPSETKVGTIPSKEEEFEEL